MKDKNVPKTLEQWIKKLKCSGSSGIGLETFPDIRVGVDPSPVTEEAVIFPDIVTSEQVRGCLGAVTTTRGEDRVTLELSDEVSLVTGLRRGLRHGVCEVYSCQGDIQTIRGMQDAAENYFHVFPIFADQRMATLYDLRVLFTRAIIFGGKN